MDKNMINRFVLPEDLKQALDSAEKIIFPKTKAQLVELCYGPNGAARFNVSYDISEKESYVEADVVRCKNGPSVNFTDAYMRRRDPDCMYIGDTNTDMQTGKAAGMYTVGVLWGFRDRKELEENHADVIIEKPEEILRIQEGRA